MSTSRSQIVATEWRAETPLGNWNETWEAMLSGCSAGRCIPKWPYDADVPLTVNVIDHLQRHISTSGEGACSRLINQQLRDHNWPDSGAFYLGCAHGETDLLLEAIKSDISSGDGVPKDFCRNLLSEGFDRLCEAYPFGNFFYSACTSAMHALTAAAMDLHFGQVIDALIIGVDALSLFGIAGFSRSQAMREENCRPFSEQSGGTVLSEGSCSLRCVRSESPERGETVLASVGMSCSGFHVTRPDPDGKSLLQAAKQALNRAGLDPCEIGAAVLHGSGTDANDLSEAAFFNKLFPSRPPPATSLKGMIGHTMGASGLHNCLVAIEALRSGLMPPALKDSSPDRLLSVVQENAVPIDITKHVLVNCSGFGGNNVVAIFSRVP